MHLTNCAHVSLAALQKSKYLVSERKCANRPLKHEGQMIRADSGSVSKRIWGHDLVYHARTTFDARVLNVHRTPFERSEAILLSTAVFGQGFSSQCVPATAIMENDTHVIGRMKSRRVIPPANVISWLNTFLPSYTFFRYINFCEGCMEKRGTRNKLNVKRTRARTSTMSPRRASD